MFCSETSMCKRSYAASEEHGHFFGPATKFSKAALALSFVFVLMAALGFYAPAASAQGNVTGTWQTLPNLMPINPVHTALMHNGQILVVSGSGNYPQQTVFYVGIWDPSTGTFINQQTQAWDEFCNGMVQLPDGRPMVAGGNLQYDPFHGWNRTVVYDPATGKYSDMEDMVVRPLVSVEHHSGRWPNDGLVGPGCERQHRRARGNL